MKIARSKRHVMRKNLVISIITVVFFVNFFQIAVGNPSKNLNQTPTCYGTGVYKPFSWWRQIQLSAAYYTNPQLRENAKVGMVYPTKYLSGSNNPKALMGLMRGSYSIVVPTPKFGQKTFSKIGSVKIMAESLDNHEKNESKWTNKSGINVIWHKGIPKKFKDNSYILVEESKRLIQGGIANKFKKMGYEIVSWEPSKMVELCDKGGSSTPKNIK